MYKEIISPDTGKKVSISSTEGKKIINRYLNYLEGGAAPRGISPLSMPRQEWIDHSTRGMGEQALIDSSLRAAAQWDAAYTQRAMQDPQAPQNRLGTRRRPLSDAQRAMQDPQAPQNRLGTRRRPLSDAQRAMQDPQAPQNRQAIATAQLSQPQQKRQPVRNVIQRAMQATAPQHQRRLPVATAQPVHSPRISAQGLAMNKVPFPVPATARGSTRRPISRTRRPRSNTGSQSPRRTQYNALQEDIAELDNKIDILQHTQFDILEKLEENSSSGFCAIS